MKRERYMATMGADVSKVSFETLATFFEAEVIEPAGFEPGDGETSFTVDFTMPVEAFYVPWRPQPPDPATERDLEGSWLWM